MTRQTKIERLGGFDSPPRILGWALNHRFKIMRWVKHNAPDRSER